jgi:hypothetical protein
MFRKPEIQHLLRCLQLAVIFIQLRLVALHLLFSDFFSRPYFKTQTQQQLEFKPIQKKELKIQINQGNK